MWAKNLIPPGFQGAHVSPFFKKNTIAIVHGCDVYPAVSLPQLLKRQLYTYGRFYRKMHTFWVEITPFHTKHKKLVIRVENLAEMYE